MMTVTMNKKKQEWHSDMGVFCFGEDGDDDVDDVDGDDDDDVNDVEDDDID